MTRDSFVGTWRLVAAEFRRADGEARDIFGEAPVGMLVYDALGNMAVQIMRPDRSSKGSRSVIGGYVAYFGAFEIDAEAGTVTHHVHGNLLPEWVGTDQVRFYQFDGDRLILRTPPCGDAAGPRSPAG